MITHDQFMSGGHLCFTLAELYRIAGSAEAAWEAYVDPEGMDQNVRRLFENSAGIPGLMVGMRVMSLKMGNMPRPRKIFAIKSGGDWTDASIEFITLPEGADIETLHQKYQEWYHNWVKEGRHGSYQNFPEWLREFAGASEPDESLIEEFWDE